MNGAMHFNSWDYDIHARYHREEIAKNYRPKPHPASTGNVRCSLRRAAGLRLIALGGWLAGDHLQPAHLPGAAESRG